MEPTSEINILPKVEFDKLSNKRKVAFWALRYGRVIVIIIHALIVTLLFHKLNLHNKLSDLSEEMEQKVAIVNSYEAVEKELLNTQAKINAIKTAKGDSFHASEQQLFIDENVPPNISIKTIVLLPNSIKFSAESNSTASFGQMIENFSSKKGARRVTLLGARFNSENNIFTVDFEIEYIKI